MAKVLIVDDDDVMVNLLTTLLEIEGYQVSAVYEDDDLLAKIYGENPDIVLMDVHLRMKTGEEISGFELLKRIRQQNDLVDLKVIMSSGIDFQGQSAVAGANAFILKPYMPNDLIGLIKANLP